MIRLPLHKSIRFKLFLFTSLLVTVLLSSTAFLDGSFLFRQLLLTRQEQSVTESRMMANQLQSVLDGWVSQMLMVTNGLAFSPRKKYQTIVRGYIKSNTEVVGFYLIPENMAAVGAAPPLSVITENLQDNRFIGKNVAAVNTSTLRFLQNYVKTIKKGDSNLKVINLSPHTKTPLLVIGMAFNVEGSQSRVWAFLSVWQTRMFSALTDSDSAYVVLLDDAMGVVTSNSSKTLLNSKALQYSEELKGMREITVNSGFKEWKSAKADLFFGTWNDLPSYQLRLYSVTSGAPIYAALIEIIKRSAYLALFVALISILLVYYAAGKTTQNLKALMYGALEIAKGNFQNRMQIRSGDEVGILGSIINYMAVELEKFVLTRTEKARLESALDTAKTVQNSYIPQVGSVPSQYKIGAFYQPAETCGGDWWGHFPINSDIHVFAIADATGHGIPAALITAMIYSMVSLAAQDVKNEAIEDISPAAMLGKFNEALCVHGSTKHTLTCFLAVIDSSRGIMKFSNAGHNMPLYYAAQTIENQSVEFQRKPLKAMGNPLGLINGSRFRDEVQLLNKNDRILFYTDGLIECTNEKRVQWGKANLVKLLKGTIGDEAQSITEQIISRAFGFYNQFPLGDDITLLVVDYQGVGSENIKKNEFDKTA